MKKGILILLIGIFSFAQSSAQDSTATDLSNEMEIVFKEMEKSMKQLENFLTNDLIPKLDSIDIKEFGIDFEKLEKELEGKDFDNFSSEDMMDIMRLQMEMIQDVDLSQLNELFESFGLPIPKMENGQKKEGKEKKPSSKKKRKTHKL